MIGKSMCRWFLVLAVALVGGGAGRARAEFLNPDDFTSLGAFPSAPFDINTDTLTLTYEDGSGRTLTGVESNGVAVFTFNSIATVGNVNLDANTTGSLPLALLSQGHATIGAPV